ncbi:hypothetical protein [Nocardia sp. R7R-8]|uniref:hypothetical protein n=1 Tax=Nocardia sp. R7R-8 TaxID=3459304 RepID=UPI00403E3213
MSEFSATHEDRINLRHQFTDVHDEFAEMRSKPTAAASGQDRILTLLTTVVARNNPCYPEAYDGYALSC